jgi:hypothetical protein
MPKLSLSGIQQNPVCPLLAAELHAAFTLLCTKESRNELTPPPLLESHIVTSRGGGDQTRELLSRAQARAGVRRKGCLTWSQMQRRILFTRAVWASLAGSASTRPATTATRSYARCRSSSSNAFQNSASESCARAPLGALSAHCPATLGTPRRRLRRGAAWQRLWCRALVTAGRVVDEQVQLTLSCPLPALVRSQLGCARASAVPVVRLKLALNAFADLQWVIFESALPSMSPAGPLEPPPALALAFLMCGATIPLSSACFQTISSSGALCLHSNE